MKASRRTTWTAVLIAFLLGAPLSRESFATWLGGSLGTALTGLRTLWTGFAVGS